MDFQRAALAVCGVAGGYIWYKRYRTFPVGDVPGPKNPSWLYGHEWWWQREDAIVVEKRLLEEYGGIARWNGTLGEARLWVADPKAIHHILQCTSYLYQKPRNLLDLLELILDKGVASVEGDAHKRQRRAMAPAFGLVEAKALYPCIFKCSNYLVDKWHDIIWNAESGQGAIINVHSWLSKATLDVIGAGAFDYDFGALEDTGNKLTKSYTNLLHAAFGRLSKEHLFMIDSLKWAPPGFTPWILERDQSPGMANIRENRTYAREVAVKLIEDKKQELNDGTPQRDLLSLLVKANSSLRPDWRLSDEEIVSQIRTIMFAGHDTVAKTLTFLLWELSKDLHVQERLRAEVMETLRTIRARGDSEFSVNDFDSMPYLLAVVKETLRIYPVVTEVIRMPNKDDLLPLSKPVVGVSGKVYKEISIPAGTAITISTVGYNMNKDVWGSDAYDFRPERWLNMDERPESLVGVYSNLATFSGGNRGCIGWRFAVIELHTFLVTLVRHFDFSLPEDGRKVRNIRQPGTILPALAGEEAKGPQLWLKVTARRSE